MLGFSNPERVPKIVSALDLKISPRELKTRDSRQLLSTIFSQWLSLSACIIQAIIDIVPAPSVAQRTRIARMIYPDAREGVLAPKNKLEEDLFSCNATATSSVVAYVSKMFAVPTKDLPEHKRQAMSADEMRRRAREVREARQAAGIMDTPEASSAIDPDSVSAANVVDATSEGESESVLGFARIYCGTIHVGQAVFAVLPKYNGDREPSHPSNLKYRLKATIQGLYTMMGRELVPVESVQAGNVFAVRGLEGIVWRNATLCAPDSGGVDNNGFNNGFDNAHDFMVNLGALHNAVRVIRFF
jgi:ribosome assembly protein 1